MELIAADLRDLLRVTKDYRLLPAMILGLLVLGAAAVLIWILAFQHAISTLP